MAKDPAFLFYYQDFIVGTTFMSNAETGAYIKTLCHLADKETITDVQIAMICDKDIEMAMKIIEKLHCIKEGIYCSKRLNIEVEKRKAFAESRRKNREGKKKKKSNKICKTYDSHMEDENENINRIKDKEEIFKKEVQKFNSPNAKEFIEYWTEPNKSGTKMRFELERTWDLKRRLSRWSNNNFEKASKPKPRKSGNFDRIQSENYDDPKYNTPRSIGEIVKPKIKE